MELILRWDVCDQVLGKMKDKCYGADERPARLRPSGRLTVFEEITIASPWRRSRPAQLVQNMEFIGIICSHGIK